MPWSGAVCACATGRMPGSASAAASSAQGRRSRSAPPSSVAATTTSADAISAAGGFLALVDVLRALGRQRVRVQLHVALRELTFFPRLRRRERCAAATHDDEQHDEALSPAHGSFLLTDREQLAE